MPEVLQTAGQAKVRQQIFNLSLNCGICNIFDKAILLVCILKEYSPRCLGCLAFMFTLYRWKAVLVKLRMIGIHEEW